MIHAVEQKNKSFLVKILEGLFGKKGNKKSEEQLKADRIKFQRYENSKKFLSNFKVEDFLIGEGNTFEMGNDLKLSKKEYSLKLNLNEKFDYLKDFGTSSNYKKFRLQRGNLELLLENIDGKSFKSNDLSDVEKIKSITKSISFIYENREKYLRREHSSALLGIKGENVINEALDIHSNLENLKNITLKDGRGYKCQCDNIVISKHGVFVIEVKNYATEGRYSLKVDSTGRWSTKAGNKITNINSPVEQNNFHLAVLNNLLKSKFGNTVEAYGLVALANNNADIINESDDKIVRASSLYNSLISYPGELSEEKIAEIKKFLLENSYEEKKYPVIPLKDEFTDDFLSKVSILINKFNDAIKIFEK